MWAVEMMRRRSFEQALRLEQASRSAARRAAEVDQLLSATVHAKVLARLLRGEPTLDETPSASVL